MTISTGRGQRFASMVLLEWDAPTLTLVRLQSSTAGQLEVAQQFTVKNSDLNAQSTQEQARWLKRQLRNNGISLKTVHIIVPRRFVATQLLSVPTRDENELSAICALQLKAREGADQAEHVGDYLAVPTCGKWLHGDSRAASVAPRPKQFNDDLSSQAGTADTSATTLFLASLPHNILESISSVSREAGLRVAGVHIAEFSLSPAAAEAEAGSSKHVSLQVLRGDKRIEFIVAMSGIPIAAQTFPFMDDGVSVASVMPALGMRVLQSVAVDAPRRLSEVCLFGEGVGVLHEHFEDFFKTQISTEEVQQSSKYPYLSLAHAISAGRPTLDFANSRIKNADDVRPAAPWQPILLAAMLLLMTLVIYGNVQQRAELSGLHSQLNRLKLTQAQKDVQQAQATCRQLAAWADHTPNWPQTLSELASCFPDAESAYLHSLRAEIDRRDHTTMEATGVAKSPLAALSLQDQIAENPNFELHPRRMTSAEDERYRANFSLQVRLEDRP